MPIAQQEVLIYLFLFIAFFFVLVVGAVLLGYRRKEKLPVPIRLEEKPRSVPPREKSLKEAMAVTEDQIFGRLRRLLQKDHSENEIWDQIEEILYTSDMGPLTVDSILTEVRRELSRSEKKNYENIEQAIRGKIERIFAEASLVKEDLLQKVSSGSKPFVIMVVGVNGVGKTTTIGKLAAYFAEKKLKVMVAAGDTFRAAASEQLRAWSERAQVEIFSPENVKDPSAVAFDALSKAKANSYEVLIIDTAGRLHTQINLMDELKKVKRVMQKILPESPHETLIVLDANSGQNALIQAKQFNEALGLTGAVLTKMDGTAKGGVAIGLVSEVGVPVKFIGIGEKISDLREFNQGEFISSLTRADLEAKPLPVG